MYFRRIRHVALSLTRARRLKYILLVIIVCITYNLIFTRTWSRNDLPNVDISARRIQDSKVRKNFVYVKMIKCGSTTLNTIFHRFGHKRNLSFVLPVKKRIYLGWPYRIEKGFYRPALKGEFNMLTEHSVYDRKAMAAIMPKDTVYITSIREPYSQFKATYNYYRLGEISTAGAGYAGFNEFMHNIERYDAIYRSPARKKDRYCIPDGFTMSKNLMSFILGIPLGYPPGTKDVSGSKKVAKHLIRKTADEFDLILILEYFHESLIMLKRIMRWNTNDILYHTANVLKYKQKFDNSAEYRKLYQQRSEFDYYLYDYANSTFWRRVAKAGAHFREEVEHFGKVKKKVDDFCASKGRKGFLRFERTSWSEGFVFTSYDCAIMRGEMGYMLDNIKHVYDVNAKALGIPEQEEPSIYFC